MPPIACPACQQINETDMAFCIFCGGTLKPGSISGRKPTVQGETCSSCGKADPLNGKFCVLCGARIAKPTPQAADPPGSVALNLASGGNGKGAKGDVAKRKRGAASAMPFVAVWAAVGLILGAGVAYASRQTHKGPAIPDKGLSILTSKPFADVLLSGEKRNFVIGVTGSDGNFYLSEPEQDTYTYSASLDNGQIIEPVPVKQGYGNLDVTSRLTAQ